MAAGKRRRDLRGQPYRVLVLGPLLLGPGTAAIEGGASPWPRTTGLEGWALDLRDDAHISKHTAIVAVDDSVVCGYIEE